MRISIENRRSMKLLMTLMRLNLVPPKENSKIIMALLHTYPLKPGEPFVVI